MGNITPIYNTSSGLLSGNAITTLASQPTYGSLSGFSNAISYNTSYDVSIFKVSNGFIVEFQNNKYVYTDIKKMNKAILEFYNKDNK